MQNSTPLFRTFLEIVALWLAAEVGYRVMIPLFGFTASYNASPIPIALYYAFWFAVSVIFFWSTLRSLSFEKNIWAFIAASVGLGALVWMANLPWDTPVSTSASYTDLFRATPWYFLPKSMDILVQQTLISVFLKTMAERFPLRVTMMMYAIVFGGGHILLFALGGVPAAFALIMSTGAILSVFIFPPLILRVPNGCVYSYMIHMSYYALVAALTRI